MFIVSLSYSLKVASLEDLNFSTIKKGESKASNALLVIGGIQGNESGGFLSADILARYYTITKGSVWVVPNLNFPSIVKNSRGLYGDMNRKFASLSSKDKDYKRVEHIKRLIQDPKVDMVLNLHDGSGFYHPKKSPRKWGQTIVIDQSDIKNVKYGKLKNIAKKVTSVANEYIIEDKHLFRVKNTHTNKGNQQMLKALTFFALENGKSAFAHETSKSLPQSLKVFYKLVAIEKFMEVMGIEYQRSFSLTPWDIRKLLRKNNFVNFEDKIKLPLSVELKKELKYFPLKKDVSYAVLDHLTAVVKNGGKYEVYKGNVHKTTLKPQYFEYDNGLKEVDLLVGAELLRVKMGDVVKVKDFFQIQDVQGFRANVIGFTNGKKNETNIKIKESSCLKRYAIDKDEKIYRVEFYTQKDNKFAGMILVDFSEQ
jgi:hypothetical protein